MKISELIIEWVNREDPEHKRIVGRYSASELYSIIKGYLRPSQFFDKRLIDITGARLITSGISAEDMLTKIFKEAEVDCEFQVKKEIQITDEIVLVAKPDFVFSDFILEVKCPDPNNIPNTIPEKWLYQLEAYWQAFEKEIVLGVITNPFSVKQIKYVPNDDCWEKIKTALQDFHSKVKKLNKENG